MQNLYDGNDFYGTYYTKHFSIVVANLDQMHKTNEKTTRNPLHRFNILNQSFGSSEGGTPRIDATTPRSPHRPLGNSFF